ISELDWNNGDEIIAFYERNQLYFDNYDSIQSKEKIYDFIDIKTRYAYQLYYKSHFDKLERVIEQIEELLPQLEADHSHYKSLDQHFRFLT
ncbi:MAG: hypothetical protein AAGA66_12290, partial [Bacteroidota bacterium]